MSNEAFYDVVNVGSARLADDGECIRDAFIKINNNSSTIFNTVLDYDTNIQFGGWKVVVGIDNSIVISNSINVSNSVGVNIANMVAATNDLDLNFTVENSLDLNIANNIDVSINGGGITLVSDASNNVVLTANSFTSSNVIYAPSLTNTTNSNNITFNSNDIDITNTTGDINISSSTNNVNITGDLVVNTNMFDINVTTGDISIQNGAITIDNLQEVNINNAVTIDASQNVNINNAITVDASQNVEINNALNVDIDNNINIGINNSIAIDNSQNITFAPSTTIDFTNISTMNLDINLVNQIDVDIDNIVNNQVLLWNSTTSKFEESNINIDIVTINNSIVPTQGSTYDLGSAENRFRDLYLSGSSINLGGGVISYTSNDFGESLLLNGKAIHVAGDTVDGDFVGSLFADDSSIAFNAQTGTFYGKLDGDVNGSIYADDSTLLVDAVSGTIPGYVKIADLKTALQDGAGDYAAFKAWVLANL
jgi:hypothetical protein